MSLQTYQLVITGNCAGQFVQNVMHYRVDDSSFANRLLSAKGLVEGWEAAGKLGDFLDALPGPYIFLSVKARCITGGGGPEYISLIDTGTTGARGSSVQTSSAGPVVLWHTDGPNRSTGKTFLAGIAVGDVEGGEISASARSAFLTAMQSYLTSFPTVGGTTPQADFCIAKASDPTTRYLITDALIGKDVGKQRRRQLPV